MSNIKKASEPTKVYVCTPLKPGKFHLKKILSQIVKEKGFAYIPPQENHEDRLLGSAGHKISIEMCDELWAFGPLGRDCSWEIGYASGLGKPVKLHIDDSNRELLAGDWMIYLNDAKIVEI